MIPNVHVVPLVQVKIPANLKQNKEIRKALEKPNLITVAPNDLPHIKAALNILNNPDIFHPSKKAGIDEPLYPVVQSLDDIFLTSIDKYINQLCVAASRDKSQILGVKKNTKLVAAATGAIRITSKYTPKIFLVKQLTCIPLGLFGIGWGLCNKKKFILESNLNIKSIERLKWANYVELNEKQRIKDGVEIIKFRADVIKDEILDSEQTGLINTDHLDEMLQLDAVMMAIAGKVLKIMHNQQKIPAKEFIEQYQ